VRLSRELQPLVVPHAGRQRDRGVDATVLIVERRRRHRLLVAHWGLSKQGTINRPPTRGRETMSSRLRARRDSSNSSSATPPALMISALSDDAE
jgi:hypothetical protein